MKVLSDIIQMCKFIFRCIALLRVLESADEDDNARAIVLSSRRSRCDDDIPLCLE